MTAKQFMPAEIEDAQAMSASEAIEYHYDNDTRFFSLWLDPTLSYSSARWRDPLAIENAEPDLTAAQLNKLTFHLDAARIPKGGSLLDIGCGWGAILKAAVTERGAARALGLTLSRDQLDHITAGGWPGAEAKLQDVYEFDTDERFDAAISIGAFEHFARPEMDRPEKLQRYRAFFDKLHTLTTPGARFSLQTIVWDALTFDEAKKWIPQTVFPQSDIPFIEEVIEGANGAFRVIYLENDPTQYADTLDAWVKTLKTHKATILAEWGEEKYTFFERYLRNSKLAFQRRKNSLARFVMVRR
ncbi:class I SAM-dependent methyltransferase [Acuticoccus mangrovi]|uniref:Class I SAM-dependent methyltransferase n=1 Tax=Acuticoccus mangrovi TaxID=2796142 RepID=A0A934IPP1_9HYPH|nr:class I SAM-dependent methyltransferase [Acuticoccus mangrovi]MBJ3776032.1 class I SAM-dependent methyltransferase [Acuticoccus mangrovi]